MGEDFEREITAIGAGEAVEKLVEGERSWETGSPSQVGEELESFSDHA